MSCGVGHKCGSYSVAVAVVKPSAAAPYGPLLWELSYAAGTAVKKKKTLWKSDLHKEMQC